MKVGEIELLDALAIYNAYREKIVHEDHFINHPVSWMLAGQAIVFAIWAAISIPGGIGRQAPILIGLALVATSLIGIILAAASGVSVNAARREMSATKSMYREKFPTLYESKAPLPYLHSKTSNYFVGHVFGWLMPVIFITMHVSAMVFVLAAYHFTGLKGSVGVSIRRHHAYSDKTRRPSVALLGLPPVPTRAWPLTTVRAAWLRGFPALSPGVFDSVNLVRRTVGVRTVRRGWFRAEGTVNYGESTVRNGGTDPLR